MFCIQKCLIKSPCADFLHWNVFMQRIESKWFGRSGVFIFLENNSHVPQLSIGYFVLESSELCCFAGSVLILDGIPLSEVKISIIDCLNRKTR